MDPDEVEAVRLEPLEVRGERGVAWSKVQAVGPVPLVEHPDKEAVLSVDAGSQHAARVLALAHFTDADVRPDSVLDQRN